MSLALALALTPPVLQLCLALLLIRRRVLKFFPFFFAYTIFAVIAETGRFFLFKGPYAYYYYFFWTTEALYAVLGFLAIYEVFSGVFRNFYRLWWFRLLLPAMGILMLALSLLIPLTRPPVHAPVTLVTIIVAEIAVRCLQVGLFVLTFLLARIF